MKNIAAYTLTFSFVAFLLVGSKLDWFASSNPDTFPKLPDEPNFNVSSEFDGEWVGRRINESNSNLCEPTTIEGKVVDGEAYLVLTYNGTPLKGWVSEHSDLTLYASHSRWDYRFSGTATNNKIQGKWNLNNGPCHGDWYVEKVG
ncbi:hypothetical protein HC752_04980 [Vibrio sp. S9_S30]|uniref:hypothetical protein n=1 Tax=Vibrio sp. S9_S30 TaxID=2720226 RepID=UPI00167FF5D3|nr:hypothetical protein [Vibrio sp. S9_S30]MBD1556284.1 hypothetical protein [Vibrio sp. S9_S30]